MQFKGGRLSFAPTDLANFLACRHKTALDIRVVMDGLAEPHWTDPIADLLRERGEEHERQYVQWLRNSGWHVVDLSDLPDRIAKTVEAMRAGVDVIVQPALALDEWFGFADVLRRVEGPSRLGSWSYEAHDTKLARETRASTVLQLCVYSELIEGVQGVAPERFCVVMPASGSGATPFAVETHRVSDYSAYYRFIKARLRSFTGAVPDTYPEPVEHCQVCRWWQECDRQRRNDDHLSFVSGISRLQRDELGAQGVTTLAQLAGMPLPFVPSRGHSATYQRVREQARLQLQQRTENRPVYELLEVKEKEGLSLLPEPSPGDLFLDLEGDPFARPSSGADEPGGREYLFGLGRVEFEADGRFEYDRWWAHTDDEEREAFEAVISAIQSAMTAHPGAHVYHFGAYEPAALKRLMGRYAVRGPDLDRLLREERFVDLLAVIRRALRAGVESYSIKRLEDFYEFERQIALEKADASRRGIERALEVNAPGVITPVMRQAVEEYNRDDCRSTHELREWLESLRTGLERRGTLVPRPQMAASEVPETVTELEQRAEELRQRLVIDLPAANRSPDEQERWVLAYLVDFHRRENKASWWEYYRLRDLAEEELRDEPKAVAGMVFDRRVGDVLNKKTRQPTGSVIDRYTYPEQELDLDDDDGLTLKDERDFGTIVALDRIARTMDVKKGREMVSVHPTSVFSFTHFNTDVLQRSLFALAEEVMVNGGGEGARSCGRELLFRRPPRLTDAPFEQAAGESAVDFAVRAARVLDRSVLAVQGPPGSGKTYTGARMICDLVQRDRLRVGVTANSHKVIRNLLEAVRRAATDEGIDIRLFQKWGEAKDEDPSIEAFADNKKALEALASGPAVLGGTAWLWASPAAVGAVDVLIVDEAGQMSLANVLAASRAAKSLVLLGDPQQLDQPRKGSHPDGVDVSALEHVLGGARVMPPEQGIFLPETWRLAPAICRFTSEAFYEGKLNPRLDLQHQVLGCEPDFCGAGLWVVEVTHEGNQTHSVQEIERIKDLVTALLDQASRWTDRHRQVRHLTRADVLIVAPYNAQVTRLGEALETHGVAVGTVDKFQGQEAPVVVYSMATSRPEDAPRGLAFLYSLNRLNVATSRARCACILVASPRLFEPECRTPAHMRLASALCRYRELATSRQP
ncbi:MAG TPA: TM0106 family RecB-like putative nuclease [Vicinamibacterales bacterium]|nr:TM0106 family RecB-like putative nuclease [Vicinamibacterales bacterium]